MTNRERVIFFGALLFGILTSDASNAWFANKQVAYVPIVFAAAIAIGLMIYLRKKSA